MGRVGLKYLDRLNSLELKRLFGRAVHRGRGAGRALMLAAHAHAARVNVSRIVLDVMPSRTQVVDFYRDLGYAPTSPYHELTYPMLVPRRLVRPADGLPEPRQPAHR